MKTTTGFHKLTAWLLTFAMIITFIPSFTVGVSAANIVASGDCGTGVTYTLDSDGVLTISGSGMMDDVVSVKQPWKDYRAVITTVVIEDGITAIGNYAFYGCTNLTTVTIPGSVITIGAQAFRGCTNLSTIEIPSSVETIGQNAFYGCTNLSEFKYLGTTAPEAGANVFKNCNKLTTVYVPENYSGDAFPGFSGSLTKELPSGSEEEPITTCTINVSANTDKGGTVTGAGEYEEGETVTVTATANPGYTFVNWTKNGTEVSNAATYSFTAIESSNLVANFEKDPVVSVTIGTTTTKYSSLVDAFNAANGKTATITMLKDYDAATETRQPYMTSSASVITFDLGGYTLYYTNLVEGSYTSRNPGFSGSVVIQNGTVKTDNRFRALGAYNTGLNTMTIKGDVVIETTNEYASAAAVQKNMTLIIEEGARITSNNSDTYTSGAICVYEGGTVILNGGTIVNKGSAPVIAPFNSADNTTVVINGGNIAAAKASDVYFNIDHTATVTGNAWYKLTNGIDASVANVSYTDNTTVYAETTYGLGGGTVKLTAAPADGVTVSKIKANSTEAVFDGGVYSFEMPKASVTLTAEAESAAPTTYTLSVAANPTEGGTVSGGGEYEENASATVTATANDGYSFVNWTENGAEVSKDASYTFTATADRSLAANFAAVSTDPEITDVTVKVNSQVQPKGAVNVKEGDAITVIYHGRNFDKLVSVWQNSNYQLRWGAKTAWLIKSGSNYTVDAEKGTVTIELDAGWFDTNNEDNKKIGYKHKNDTSFTYPYTVNYTQPVTAEPRITGVKVKINGVEQPAGEISVVDSDEITVIYYGENFEALNGVQQDYKYRVAANAGSLDGYSFFTFDTTVTPNTATKVFDGLNMRSGTVGYTNKGETEVTVYTIKSPSSGEEEVKTARITGARAYVNGVGKTPGDIVINGASDTLTVEYCGENFEKLAAGHKYRVGVHSGSLGTAVSFTVDTEKNTASRTFTGSYLSGASLNVIAYQNPDDTEETVVYTINREEYEAVPRIIGVKVFVNGEEKPEGVVYAADTDEVTIVFYGEHLNKSMNTDYRYTIGAYGGPMNNLTLDKVNHTATKVFRGKYINNSTKPISYTNKGEAAVVTGYVFAEPAVTYKVTVDDSIANGTVTVDKAEAETGEIITLTVTPAEGYKLNSITAMHRNDPVTVTDNKFTMPAGDVRVHASFKPIEYVTVNLESPRGLEDTVKIDIDATVAELKAAVAEKCSVSFGAGSEYRLFGEDLQYPNSKLDEDTKVLRDIGFANRQTIHLEKSTSWDASGDEPIKIFGLTITGGKGSQEPYGDYNNVDYYWNYAYKTITIRSTAKITISGKGEKNTNIIIKKAGNNQYTDLTVSDLTLTNEDSACINVQGNSWVKLTILGNNSLTTSPGADAGLTVSQTPALTLTNSGAYLKIMNASTGTLTATTNFEGQPGIGTYDNTSSVWGVEINGGTIIANGGEGAAGIRAQAVCIYGGNVTANGGIEGYGFNSIYPYPIEILGGTVTAVSRNAPALSNAPNLDNYEYYRASASVDASGANPESYDSAKNATYKYFNIVARDAYTVKFDANGGTGSMENQIIDVGIPTTLSANAFTRDRFEFIGWSDSATGGVAYADEADVKDLAAKGEKITLYAVWKENVYAVTVYGGTADKSEYNEGETVTVTADTPETGYKFTGWTSEDGVVFANAAAMQTTFEMPAKPVAVKADYVEKQSVSITEEAQTYVYSGQAYAFAVDSALADFKLEYSPDGSGAWSDTLPVNAGKYDVRITRAEDDIYKAYSKTIISGLVINKVTVNAPVIASKVYNGSMQTAEVPTSGLYNVTSNNGGTAKGEYDVVIALADAVNYKWADTEDASITLKFTITAASNAWVNEPAINDWTYGAAASNPTSEAKFGSATVEYKKKAQADTEYKTAVPTDAGEYTARFSVAETENYGALSKAVDFKINKAQVAKPAKDDTSFVYNKSEQTYSLAASELYRISNNTRTDAGSQDVTVALKDKDNYEWADGTTDDVKFTFSIAKAQAVITVDSTPIVKTYGEEFTLPTATTNFGTVSANKTAADMKNVGSYTVTYTVVGNDNYNGAVKDISVTINPKKIDKPAADSTAFTYNGNTQTYNVAKSEHYTVTGTARIDAGSQDVTVALKDKDNFRWADGTTDDVKFTFSIAQRSIADAAVGAFEQLTYTGKAQTPTASVTVEGLTVTGTWSDVTNVADTTTFTANGNFTGTVENKATGMLKADSSVTAPAANTLTYNEAAQYLVTAGAANGGILKYSLDKETWAESVPAATNAGSYEVWYKVFGDANHNDTAEAKADVVIAKKSIADAAITLLDTLTYNREEQVQNVAVTLEGYAVTFDVTGNRATNVNTEGNYVLTVTANGNFEGEKTLEWNIAKADHVIEGGNIPTANRLKLGNGLYSSAISPAELKDEAGNVLGTFAWLNPEEKMNSTGTHIKQVLFTPTDAANYNERLFDVSIYIYRNSITGGGSGGSTGGNKTDAYIVNFNSNGGSHVTSKTVERGDTVAEPAAPTKAGFTFLGWYTDSKLTNAYDFGSKVTKGITLYAKWEKVSGETPAGDEKSEAFKDVGENDWFLSDVEYVVENGLFNGVGTSTFAPNGLITRAMLVTVLYRADGEPAITVDTTFEDVPDGKYYSDAVVWAQQNGIVKGYSATEFRPEQNITREQIAAIMHRYAQYKGYDVSVGENTNILSYSDFDSISEYAIPSLQYAVGSGIMKGKTEATLNPHDNATRAEIAAILHRFIEANK